MLKVLPVLAILMVACDNSDDHVNPPAPRPVSVRIDGPTQVTVPAQVQFAALQTWSDGSSRDVSAAANWTSTNLSVLSINAGRGSALAGGEVRLTAQFEQLTSQPKTVFINPATPEWNGAYTLTVGGGPCSGSMPLPPELTQRTYAALIQQNSLTLSVTIANVGFFSGQITNPEVRFTLINSALFPRRHRRAAGTEGVPYVIRFAAARSEHFFDDSRFWRFAYSGFEEPLTERLPNGNRLVITGSAVTTMSPAGFTGSLNGSLALYEPSRNNLLAVCTSSSHGFTLVRN